MNEQINLTQVQAMLTSLRDMLDQANASVVTRDGVIAMQAEEIKQLKERIATLEQPTTEKE